MKPYRRGEATKAGVSEVRWRARPCRPKSRKKKESLKKGEAYKVGVNKTQMPRGALGRKGQERREQE